MEAELSFYGALYLNYQCSGADEAEGGAHQTERLSPGGACHGTWRLAYISFPAEVDMT